jgi:hypothetical protein
MQRTVGSAVLGVVIAATCLTAQGNAGGAGRSVADSLARHWREVGMSAYRAGDVGRAAEAFARQADVAGDPTAMFNAGAMRARLGLRDSALVWLERAAAAGFRGLHALRTDADLGSLRSDPRLASIEAAVERNFMPCASRPEARKFDFWVGEWEVRSGQGRVVGHSRIEIVSGQCALLENWTDASGATGKSLNAYNPSLNRWQQFWVGQGGGVTEFRDSHWEESSLVFTAMISPDSVRRHRLTFTPLSSDLVRQLGEQSDNGGASWTVRYDFTYHRVVR